MVDEDWRQLEKIASSLRASGVNATAGQIAGQLLRDAISGLKAKPLAYPLAPQAGSLRVSEASLASAAQRRRGATGSTPGVTYLVGAGINRGVFGPGQHELPLARDFFKYVLAEPRFSSKSDPRLQPLWDFIERYWHTGEDVLRAKDFDLEECFTLLELQRIEARNARDVERLRLTSETERLLGGLLAECFGRDDGRHYFSPRYQELGRRIFEEKAAVLTFNYDTLLEAAIADGSPAATERTSHPSVDPPSLDVDVPDYFSHHSWNPLLAYKVHFDELVVRAGLPIPESGEKYYAWCRSREAEHPAFLKLHGSVDWYYRSGYSMVGEKWIGTEGQEPRTRFYRADPRFDFPVLDHEQAEVLLPLLITPVLNKSVEEHPFFGRIWQQARETLKRTKTLIVAGYSFPPTDFHVRRLLREAFAANALDQLCVVNPDASVASIARKLCNFRKPILVCRDIGEYLSRVG